MTTIAQALTLACQHQQAGDFASAEQICRRILQVQPNHTEALWVLGLVCQGLRKFADAAVSYRAALRLNPYLAEVHNNLGHVLRVQGQFDEAIDTLRQALRLKPDLVFAYP